MDEKKISVLLDGKTDLVRGAKEILCFADGAYSDKPEGEDIKLELIHEDGVWLADVSAGTAFRLPVTDYNIDYIIAKYRTKITFDDCVLSVSTEKSNPYTDREDPWFIYGEEWLMRYLFRDEYLKNCGITRLKAPKHPFSREEPYGDLDVKKGYDVCHFAFRIEGEGIEYPYYSIGVVKPADDDVNFVLFVLKSATEKDAVMEELIASCTRFAPKGVQKNYFDAGDPKENPRWTEETRSYFRKLSKADRVEWGVFSYSMPGLQEQLDENNEDYLHYLKLSRDMEQAIEEGWGKPFDIYPTYTHLGKGESVEKYDAHYFPSAMAKELAGGNGFNGKPVLQFTYQFTLNNNLVGENQTPAFDILRGKFDEQFRRLAKDIKAYEKPVLFRLNNEMNTDWTSYCGMVSLLDPDICCENWRRLYRIFEEEGVRNCIWIWNPIATSCPYSAWGEDLCYFPGVDYAQMLGGTSYEMNNYKAEEAPEKIVSFKKHYQSLYQKNKAAFSRWSMILSEFACGSGGDCSGELGRNTQVQAQWVRDMFKELHAKEKPDWVKQLKGAIWFNCNDESGDKVMNRLRFIDPEGEKENATVQAFRECFREERQK